MPSLANSFAEAPVILKRYAELRSFHSARTSMANPNRRQFLHKAGSALTSAAILPNLSALGALASTKKIRGVMVDAARVPETLDYYRRVIAFCADWQLNAVHFRLADDQGTALRFTSVPGLVNHEHAFTAEELRDLVRFGTAHGVDLIPEIESFGHTGFITRSAVYKHLLDDAPDGSAEFTGIIPVHPETLHLFENLYREIASIFPARYLHGGCDEVNWGGSELSRQALRAKSRSQIWIEYLDSLSRVAEGLGRQFIVWGDLVLHKNPEILEGLNKNIIIMDWNYWDTDADGFHRALDTVKAHGARAIGGPGLISYRWGGRVGASQLGNIDAFAEAYLGKDDPASLGVILTNWVPSRYLQNSIWDGFAYGAVAFNDGPAAARKFAFQRFVERHYKAEWNQGWAHAFQLLYDAAPGFGEHAPSEMPVPWSSDEELEASLKREMPASTPFASLSRRLSSLAPLVRANMADFRALMLCVEYLEEVFWRESVIRARASSKALSRTDATALIGEIAARDRRLAAELSADWDEGRFHDATAKTAPLYGMQPKDQLVFQFNRAAGYASTLAHDPERFYKLVQASGLATSDHPA